MKRLFPSLSEFLTDNENLLTNVNLFIFICVKFFKDLMIVHRTAHVHAALKNTSKSDDERTYIYILFSLFSYLLKIIPFLSKIKIMGVYNL